ATPPASITVTADTIRVTNSTGSPTNPAEPGFKADTSGAAPAGNILLNANTLTAQATISSTSTGATSGAAGNIRLQGQNGFGTLADTIVLDGSRVLTSTAGTGRG